MNKKIAAIGLIWILINSFILIFIETIPTIEATTITVDDSGGADYFKIQDALNASKNGDTVYVYSGIYNEYLTVKKSINLIGEDRENTIINGSINESVIAVRWIDDVNISNLTVINGRHGIYYWISENSSITNCNSTLNDIGFFIRDSYNFTIMDCNSNENRDQGIYLWYTEFNTITNCTSNLNGGENYTGNGIYIRYSDNNTLISCISNKNAGNGIYNDGSNNCIYEKCTSNSNGRNSYFGRGISISGSYNCAVSNSTFNNNNFSGIAVYSEEHFISNNTCNFNNYDGISTYQSERTMIVGNNIMLNDNYGIHIQYSSYIFMENNNLTNDGTFIWGDQLAHFNTHNIPTSNSVNKRPLYYYKNQSNFDIKDIPLGQIILANCTDINLESLEINNTDVALEIAYSSVINISDNKISYNNIYGFYFYSSSVSTLINNNFLNNTIYGCYFYSSSMNTIINNIFSNNKIGLAIYLSINNLVHHNHFNNNFYQGFDFTDNGNKWDDGYPSGGNYWSDY
jgi:parallel beta-helix repeat protein